MPQKIRERSEIDDRFKWNLDTMYSDEKAWKDDMEKVENSIGRIREYRGKLGDSSAIADLIRLTDEISRVLEKAYTYAHLRHDEDLRVTRYQELHDIAVSKISRLENETSFIIPEILSHPSEFLDGLLHNSDLEFARVPLRDIIRKKDHFLSEREEGILAMADEALETPSKAFRMLNDADLKFGNIKNEEGRMVELSHGRYVTFLTSGDRDVRRRAFKKLYSVFKDHRNTFAALLEGELKKRMFRSTSRKYGSSLEASLDNDEVTVEVYDSLIKAVREHLSSMHQYLDIRREVLNIDKVHLYDVHAPLVKDFDRNIPYEEAWDIVMEALKPLGREISSILKKARKERWIDVLENRGKRSGAYSSGCYDSQPFILMNYEEKINDVFTLAHELGHSVHTYLSNKNQPHITADYRIFVAEVASTVNENLLLHHLSSIWTSDRERAYLVNHHLDSFKGTVFRQTMFAEFEKIISEMVDERMPLTAEGLSEIYGKLNRDHFGPRTHIDDEIELEWARIPHFYYNFYVYKYATGYSAATAISNGMVNGTGDLEAYIDMLKSGGSKPPVDLLKDAGVDLTTPAPVNKGLELFDSLVRELSKMV